MQQNSDREPDIPETQSKPLARRAGVLSRLTTRFTRRAVVGTLLLLVLSSTISSATTWRLMTSQQKLTAHYRGQDHQQMSKEEIKQLEGEVESSAGFVQALFVLENLLAGCLLGIVYLNLTRERTERRQQEKRLRQVNLHLAALVEEDSLTTIKNRRAFESRLREEWERSRRYQESLSLLLIDVDHFKKYNDAYGHQAGDAALKLVADILSTQSRLSDFVARYGGEEFAILLPHTGVAAATLTADRVRAAFIATHWPERPVTASVGVSTMTPEMKSPSDLVHEADRALYWAKYTGRNRVIHYQETEALAAAPPPLPAKPDVVTPKSRPTTRRR